MGLVADLWEKGRLCLKISVYQEQICQIDAEFAEKNCFQMKTRQLLSSTLIYFSHFPLRGKEPDQHN